MMVWGRNKLFMVFFYDFPLVFKVFLLIVMNMQIR